jgi:hypothetical protein
VRRQPQATSSKRQARFWLSAFSLKLATVLTVATLLAYARSFAGGFVSDDVTAIAENPLVRSLSPSNLYRIITSFDDANYIPLKVFTLAVDYQLWGLDPAGYHLTNLLLHIANALLVYLLLLRLGETPGFAATVALLWALHPVQVESVAWISERKNVLSTFFFLLAFRVYLDLSDEPRPRRYMLLGLLFVAALLSKLNTIVLPALMLAYEIVLRRRLRGRDLAVALPLLGVGAVIAWVNLALSPVPVHGVRYHGGSLAVTLRTSATTIPRYLGLLVAPVGLSTYYPVPLRASWLDPTVLGALGVIAAFGVLTGFLALRRRPEAFWLLWFAITLSPMLNLVPFPALMADRYLYLPSLGVLVLLARAARALANRFRLAHALPLAAATAALTLGMLTAARVPVWHDKLSLWADWALRFSYITSDRPYAGAQPRLAERRLLENALVAHPERAALHNNLGAIDFEGGRLAAALPEFIRARTLDPADPAIALNLGRAYLLTGQLDDAIATLEAAAIQESPSFFVQLNLARAYLRKGDLPRARAALARAQTIRTEPHFWSAEARELARAESGGS